jgi:hypothetical protein
MLRSSTNSQLRYVEFSWISNNYILKLLESFLYKRFIRYLKIQLIYNKKYFVMLVWLIHYVRPSWNKNYVGNNI